MYKGIWLLRLLLFNMCLIFALRCAGDRAAGTFVSTTKPQQSALAEQRTRDLSSPYHVSNRWREHSCNSASSSEEAFFNDHAQYAR
jgi:hypothetical protein